MEELVVALDCEKSVVLLAADVVVFAVVVDHLLLEVGSHYN